MGFVKGKNLRLSFNGKKLLHATECSISISSDTEEIATKDTNGKLVIAGDYGYTIATSALVATLPVGNTTHIVSDTLVEAQLAGTEVAWEFQSGDEGTKIYSGTALVTQSDITAANGSIANTGFTLTGSGDITWVNVD